MGRQVCDDAQLREPGPGVLGAAAVDVLDPDLAARFAGRDRSADPEGLRKGRTVMAKRMLFMLGAVAAFLAIIGFVKFRQVQGAIAQASSFQPPPEAVTTIVAQQESWQRVLRAIGSVVAVNGVTLSADLPGIVEKITFQSGDRIRAGELLVRLDARQEQAQLVAAEAQRALARMNFERARGLMSDKVI